MIKFERCETLDPDGLLCFRGLSHAAQDALYRGAFPAGAEGECGGLMTQEERARWKELGQRGEYTVESCFGKKWHVEGESQVAPLSDMGFHGRHHLSLAGFAGGQELLNALRTAAPSCPATKPPEFQPEYVSVSYENLGGRVIKGTLCGTAYDDDRCSRRGEVGDGTPKAFLFLGRAAVTVGFKWDKSDRQWLKVRLAPGDCLLRYGAARAWCMGVLKIDSSAPEGRGEANPCPVDFLHVKLQDHRRLRKEKPDLFARCHAGRIDPKDDKFNMNPGCFQYAYTVLERAEDDPVSCRVANDNGLRYAAQASGGRLGHGVTMAQACYVDTALAKDRRAAAQASVAAAAVVKAAEPQAPVSAAVEKAQAAGDEKPGKAAPRRRWKAKAAPEEAVSEALAGA